ncbi:MAG: arsenate reductase (glutaredoxin) [Burkholderiales bacterium]
MNAITIYHNPHCSNSRGALALIREAGIEPQIIDYLADPPDRATLLRLIRATGQPVRTLMREKEAVFIELGLANPALSDDALIDALLAHPVLINRPIVVSPKGTRLCRPPELVKDLLPG